MAKNEQVAIQLINLWIYLFSFLWRCCCCCCGGCGCWFGALAFDRIRISSEKWNNLFLRNNICLWSEFGRFFLQPASVYCLIDVFMLIRHKHAPKEIEYKRDRVNEWGKRSTSSESICSVYKYRSRVHFLLQVVFVSLLFSVFLALPFALSVQSPSIYGHMDKHWNKWHRSVFSP